MNGFLNKLEPQLQAVLSSYTQENDILVAMLPYMPDIRALMQRTTRQEMDNYLKQHPGFGLYMKLLERLAARIANGDVDVPE